MANWDITALSSAVEHDTSNGTFNTCLKVDDTHYINVWQGASGDGFAQVFLFNASTGAVSEIGTPLEFNTADYSHGSLAQVDSNHFILFYSSTDGDGFATILEVNLSTFAVTEPGSELEFDTADATFNSCFRIDGTHFINFWTGTGVDGFVRVFEVNTGTWAITGLSTALEFDTTNGSHNDCCQVDANHFINFWNGTDGDGFARVFEVNLSTWAVTAVGSSALEFDTATNFFNSCIKINATHVINFWQGGANETLFGRVLNINLSTWAVTGVGSAVELDSDVFAGPYGGKRLSLIDSSHVILFWEGGTTRGFDGFARVLEFNIGTGAITAVGTADLEYDTVDALYTAIAQISRSRYIAFWGGSGSDGFTRAFEVTVVEAAPTVALNTTDATSFVTATPTLEFTGTDANGDDISYNLNIHTENTFGLVDSYSESNQNIFSEIGASSDTAVGQSFTGIAGTLDRAEVLVSNSGTGTENIFAKIYAHTGVFGTASVPTGAALATSTGVALSAVPSTMGLVTFYFTGADRITLSAATNYVLVIEKTAEGPGTGISIGRDSTSPTHAGNFSQFEAVWVPTSTSDLPFYVYTDIEVDALSGTDAGFANTVTPADTDPFNSGEKADYDVQSSLANDTYYWRVRGKDPAGSNTFGAWSSIRSFDVAVAGGTSPGWASAGWW